MEDLLRKFEFKDTLSTETAAANACEPGAVSARAKGSQGADVTPIKHGGKDSRAQSTPSPQVDHAPREEICLGQFAFGAAESETHFGKMLPPSSGSPKNDPVATDARLPNITDACKQSDSYAQAVHAASSQTGAEVPCVLDQFEFAGQAIDKPATAKESSAECKPANESTETVRRVAEPPVNASHSSSAEVGDAEAVQKRGLGTQSPLKAAEYLSEFSFRAGATGEEPESVMKPTIEKRKPPGRRSVECMPSSDSTATLSPVAEPATTQLQDSLAEVGAAETASTQVCKTQSPMQAADSLDKFSFGCATASADFELVSQSVIGKKGMTDHSAGCKRTKDSTDPGSPDAEPAANASQDTLEERGTAETASKHGVETQSPLEAVKSLDEFSFRAATASEQSELVLKSDICNRPTPEKTSSSVAPKRRRVAPKKSAAIPERIFYSAEEHAVLAKAELLGLGSALRNLAAREGIAGSDISMERLLSALQDCDGLVNKAKNSLLVLLGN